MKTGALGLGYVGAIGTAWLKTIQAVHFALTARISKSFTLCY